MLDLKGKTVLLFMNHGYAAVISDTIRRFGGEAIYINDKPKNNFFHKAMGRWKIRPYLKYVLEKYYRKQIDALTQKIDYVLAIRGEYTPENALLYVQKKFPDARRILYMWDSIRNNRGIEKKWPCYDDVWTFDRRDYLQHQGEIRFLPLFYCDSMLPEETDEEPEYDISFVGTGHGDRIAIVKQFRKICLDKDWHMYDYIYVPHQLVFLYNKVTNRFFRNVRMSDVHFSEKRRKEVYDIYNHSLCILDAESKTQTGLTMRTIEILGMRKKLLTTNQDIVNYDFYHPDNICVFDREHPSVDDQFMKAPYHRLPDEIYRKYSLSSWVETLLTTGEDNGKKEPVFTK